MKRNCLVIVLLVGVFGFSNAADYHVSTSGNDASGNGSQARPWRTLHFALSKVPANQGHTIKLSAGTFIEKGQLVVPTRVNIEGAGSSTILKGASSFHYKMSGKWDYSKFLISLTNGNSGAGQYLKNFTIDGDGRKLYGGIFVRRRNNVLIENVTVNNTGFVGIWFMQVNDSRITRSKLKDCAWFGGYGTGSICIADVERVELDHLQIMENHGNAIKAMGVPGGYVNYLKLHDNDLATGKEGRWINETGSTSPTIAFELFDTHQLGNEVYNNHFKGNVSLVTSRRAEYKNPKNRTAIRLYNNHFDVSQYPGNYGLELSIHDAVVDHNFFNGGAWGITDWVHEGFGGVDAPFQNWKIHHNVFYNIKSSHVPGIIRTRVRGIKNLEFYNNTIEFTGSYPNTILQLIGGTSSDLKLKNNLIINNINGNNKPYPPLLVRVAPAARISGGLEVTNNFLQNLPIGNVSGRYTNNLSGDPQINKSGNRPDPYYKPKSNSPLINKGVNVGLPYSGSAPDIGAYEVGSTSAAPPTNEAPSGAIAGPSNNSTFAEGVTITIKANAGDKDGSVQKVEFYSGTTKIGEDTSDPYSIEWKDASPGTHKLTIKVTDDKGATFTSPAVTITVVAAANVEPTVTITGPAVDAEFDEGETINIKADAKDSDGEIKRVEFYAGSTKIGEDNTGPYSFEWKDAKPGDYSITVKVTDNKDASTTSKAVTITVKAPSNEAPAVALSSPANNSTHVEGEAITLRATANDSDGTVQKVEFFQGTTKLGEDNTAPYSLAWDNAKVGSYAITAKATDNKNAVGTSAPLSIHVTAPSNSLPIVELTSPKDGATVNAGNITLSATASDSDGAITKVEFYNGTTKLGEDLSSPYSFEWKDVKPGKYNLTALATDNKSGSTTSEVVTINVVDTNKKPTVVITSPEDNASFNNGASITINATATDSDGAVARVEFFNGNTKLGEDTSSPFSYTWTGVQAGNYTITARATDNKSAVTTSTAVNITVAAAVVPNKPPVVQLTNPSNNARFDQGASVTLSASATDSDGTVTKVGFYNGSTLLGEDTSSPYSYTWSGLKAGTYTLTAKATDNRSGVTTSTAVVITVIVPNKAPVVQVTSPSNNATFTEGQSIPIKATATDSDGSIVKVQFYSGTTLLGEDTSAPYSLDWANAQPGKYEIIAKATDNSGATAAAKVNIVVEEQVFVPVARAGNDISVELPENTVQLSGQGQSDNGEIVKYEWSQVEGPEGATIKVSPDGGAEISNLTEGTYRFELTITDNKNMKAKDVITVRVYPLPITSVELPRIFSPNGDGINDYWEWSNTELFRDSKLVIFNRHGQKIFEVTSYDNTWDGNHNGTPLQEDAYYYVITSSQGELTGAVRIVR